MHLQSPSSIVALSFLVFLVIKLYTGFKYKSKLNRLPEPWRLPLIGHVHHLIGTLPHRRLRDLAKIYGPLMHLQLGEVSAIVVSNPHWAKEILTTHDITFANRPETLIGEIVAYHNTDIVLAPYGEYWRRLRKLSTSELLGAKKVKSFQSLREEECWNLVKALRSSGSGSPVNLSEHIFTVIATILSRAAFGQGIKDRTQFKELFKEILRVAGGFDVADIFPSKKLLHRLSGKRPKLTKIHRKLDNLINNIMSEHLRNHASTTNETLLDVLLKLKDRDEFPLTANNVKAVIFDMFGGGTQTSSATIEWAISELLRNPRAMEKAQAELKQVLKGKERIQEQDIRELSYLKLVIKETLRLHPPLPLAMPRECREPCVLGGYDIAKKTKLIVNVFAINTDPEYWKEAESFIPERFENNATSIIGADYEYLPFGAGRRMCAGSTLALANVEFVLAHILYYFNWKLANEERAEDLDMTESFGLTVQRVKELILVPTF